MAKKFWLKWGMKMIKFLVLLVIILFSLGCETKPLPNNVYRPGDVVKFKISESQAIVEDVYSWDQVQYRVTYFNKEGEKTSATVYEYELEKPVVAEKAIGEVE